MEFKAIIDAKARNDAGCAVVGVYEDADLGIAAARQQSSRGCGIFATAKNCPRQELPRHDKRMEYSAVLPITRLDGRQICD